MIERVEHTGKTETGEVVVSASYWLDPSFIEDLGGGGDPDDN